MPEDRTVVGVVGKPFGLTGEVYVRPDPDVSYRFTPGKSFALADGSVTVQAARDHAGRTVVRFADVDDRAGAEALRGTVLSVPRAELELERDAFWTSDLIGRDVVDADGRRLGVVEGAVDGPAHDYLALARVQGGRALIPSVAELLTITDDRIVVANLPGLLDEEE
ncbi:MAG: ribosome maturation factor RimM [Egibacteraceae bacterium]